jgi:hypothetical protein
LPNLLKAITKLSQNNSGGNDEDSEDTNVEYINVANGFKSTTVSKFLILGHLVSEALIIFSKQEVSKVSEFLINWTASFHQKGI